MIWHDPSIPGNTPGLEQLVWVVEAFYHRVATIGYWDGFTWRLWYGSDDCYVTHWAHITYPELPR